MAIYEGFRTHHEARVLLSLLASVIDSRLADGAAESAALRTHREAVASALAAPEWEMGTRARRVLWKLEADGGWELLGLPRE